MKRDGWVSIIQGIVALAILLLLVRSIDPDLALSLLTTLDIRFLVLAGLCYFLNNLVMVYRIKRILYITGENIRFRVVFLSHMAGMLLSDFTPARSGYLYVAAGLKERGIPMETGVATITSLYLYDLAFKMIVAILGACFLYSFVFDGQLSLAIILTFIFISGVIAVYFVLMYPPERIRNLFLQREVTGKLLVFGEQSRSIQKSAPLILSVTLCGWILRGLEWFLIGASMHQVILTPVDSLLLNPLLTLFSLIPLTPGGWGIQEAGIVLVFRAIGISATVATSFALITRLMEVAIDLLGMIQLLGRTSDGRELASFYNRMDGDIDDKAYHSDLLVQRYFQRRKTAVITKALEVDSGHVVLDVGCGSGVQLAEICGAGCALAIGIDLSLNAVRFGRERGLPNTEFILADAEYLPIRSSAVDRIISAEIIEHLRKPDCLVREMDRTLKKGGVVVITTPNDRSVWGIYELLWDHFGRGRNYGMSHLGFFSESALREKFFGFSETRTETLFFISPLFALTNSSSALELGKRLDRFFERLGLGVSILFYGRK